MEKWMEKSAGKGTAHMCLHTHTTIPQLYIQLQSQILYLLLLQEMLHNISSSLMTR